MKRFFIFIVCLIIVERFAYIQTGGFDPYKIICPIGLISNAQNTDIEEARTILQQPFYYLDKGGQFFAFQSADGKYVLKIVKHRINTPKFWFSHKTFSERISKVIDSCLIAYKYLKEETALIAIHLQPTQRNTHFVQLYDKLGIGHMLDLNRTAYVIQKKAVLFKDQKLCEQDIDGLIQLLRKQADEGIIDSDPRLQNFGFVDNKPIKIDVGSFTKNYSLKEAIEKGTYKLKKRLEHSDTTLFHYLKQKTEDQ